MEMMGRVSWLGRLTGDGQAGLAGHLAPEALEQQAIGAGPLARPSA